jgi:membrane fusion protein, multidrug efflux system
MERAGGAELSFEGSGVEEARDGQQTPADPPDGGQSHQPAGSRSPPRHRGWKRIRSAAIWIGCAVVIGVAAWWYWTHRREEPQASRMVEPGALTVTATQARRGNIPVYLEAIGTVTPLNTASITSQVNGVITAVHYTEGQLVHKGDPLIDIDPRQFEAQVLQAQGALQRDLNVLAQARMDLERYREAWARNAIARQQLEDQEKIVLQDEGLVRSDQGNLHFFEVQLGWAHITAPFTGRVGLRLVDPGNVVVLSASNQINATTSLVVLTQTQPITVVFTLAQDNLSEVRTRFRGGTELLVYAFDRTLETRLATGVLTAIDNQIDTTTGTVKLRATFANANEALFPNQFVNTRLRLKILSGVTVVPNQAIQHNGPTAFVFAIRNGKAHIAEIKTGPSEAGMTAVEGIPSGTVVITSNFEKLREGIPVAPTARPAPTGATGAGAP